MRKQLFILGMLCLVSDTGHADQICQVAQEVWDRPRTGRTVLALTALKPCIADFVSHSGANLVLHHGAAAETSLYAEELRAWLGALAVDSSRVQLINDLKQSDSLYIEVRLPK